MNEHRVVVTGLGIVAPIGIGTQNFWTGLTEGKNGIGPVTHFDVAEFRSKLAAEVSDFDPENWIDSKSVKRMDRFTQFAIAASAMAIEEAGLVGSAFDPETAGVIIGSGIGGSQTIEDGSVTLREKGPSRISPFFVSMLLVNMAAAMVSIRFGLKGPMSAPSVACSTGVNAIGDAYRILQRGDADVMVAGGSEACITPIAYGGFCATRSMTPSDDPESACRPFDRNRDGFVMGEGAGIVVIESLGHARARNSKVYAEIVGYGNTADAYHFTAPEPNGDGMRRAMSKAIVDAHLAPEDIDYVNAHGTSTAMNDKCESAAIVEVFGDHAPRLRVSSNKSMIGHLLAGAGAAEFVATVLTLYHGVVPPTIHYTEEDPECPLDYVVNGKESVNVRAAISNSFGFGGGNSCIVLKRFEA